MKPLSLPLGLALLALAACSPPPGFPPIDSPSTGIGPAAAAAEPTPAQAASVATCAGTDILALVGQDVKALPASGPWSSVRVLKPGSAATMDYSPTRLNVSVNNAGKVLSVGCG